MSVHVSEVGIEDEADGFVGTTCTCGAHIGPMPDLETLLDAAMEHAYNAGLTDAVAIAGT